MIGSIGVKVSQILNQYAITCFHEKTFFILLGRRSLTNIILDDSLKLVKKINTSIHFSDFLYTSSIHCYDFICYDVYLMSNPVFIEFFLHK